MAKLEPYVKKWYGFLDEDKIMGVKCKKCGAVEFPPVPICNSCSGMDMDWIEISGKGELVSFSALMVMDPPFEAFGPQVCGLVKLEEGPSFVSWLVGVGLEEQPELLEKLPLKVKAECHQRDKYKYPVFRVVTE